MLELNCETDFVARNEQFTELAHNIALQIAAMSPKYVAIEDVRTADLEDGDFCSACAGIVGRQAGRNR